MVVLTINTVLKVYNSLLNHTLSYADADVWAAAMIEEYENKNLIYEPIPDKDTIWEILNFLHGIDMPGSIEPHSPPLITDADIIDFLKEKNLYERAKELDL
jgi:hypothetical protein